MAIPPGWTASEAEEASTVRSYCKPRYVKTSPVPSKIA